MKIRELTKEDVARMLTEKGDSIELMVRDEETDKWERTFVRSVNFEQDSELIFNCMYRFCGIEEVSIMRKMNDFETMKKIALLQKENQEDNGKVWLLKDGKGNLLFPITLQSDDPRFKNTFAQYDSQGNQISEDFKFEIEV